MLTGRENMTGVTANVSPKSLEQQTWVCHKERWGLSQGDLSGSRDLGELRLLINHPGLALR